jgi:hypothetical protein
MRKRTIIITTCLLAAVMFGLILVDVNPFSQSLAAENGSWRQPYSIPLYFTENLGQFKEEACFMSRCGYLSMWFGSAGVTYRFDRRSGKTSTAASNRRDIDLDQLVIKTSFIGAHKEPLVVGSGLTQYMCHYYHGDDPSEWVTDVPNYLAVSYLELYSGIDLTYYGSDGRVEYDFSVKPWADYSQIRLKYEGVTGLSLNENGDLIIATRLGNLLERLPLIYQEIDGVRSEIAGSFVILPENTVTFKLSEDYDREYALVIDPELCYSTYLGGGGGDVAYDVAVDEFQRAYVVGVAAPQEWEEDTSIFCAEDDTFEGGAEAFVTKFDECGTHLLFSTYVGGNLQEEATCVALDDSGSCYVGGYTLSADFPLISLGYDTVFGGGQDGFVIKLDSAGHLIFGTYLGGSDTDEVRGIAVDENYNVYAAGETKSSYASFHTSGTPGGGLNEGDGGYDAFVTKLDTAGTSVVFTSFLGGSEDDRGRSLAVSPEGSAYLLGGTNSPDFDTVNPRQGNLGGDWDAFVARFDTTGSSLIYSTYHGGEGSEFHPDSNATDILGTIVIDSDGNAYITGHATDSAGFPLDPSPMFNKSTGVDTNEAYMSKISPSGDALVWSTFLQRPKGHAISIDAQNNVYVVTDQELIKICPKATSIRYSVSYNPFHIWGLEVTDDGIAFVVGEAGSSLITSECAWDTLPSGTAHNAFVWKVLHYVCLEGDANGDGSVDIDDTVYLVAYIFSGGCAPDPLVSGDADCNDEIDIDDVVYLVAFIFSGGPAPCNDNCPATFPECPNNCDCPNAPDCF